MKKVFIILSIIVFVFVFIATIPLVNDITAMNIVRRLENIPLPDNTEIVETISRAEKMVGNGNGMQYFGAILIKSDLSIVDLKNYYSKYSEKNFDCLVKKQTSQKAEPVERGTAVFKTIIDENDNYYIVYTWGKGLPFYSQVDLRGH